MIGRIFFERARFLGVVCVLAAAHPAARAQDTKPAEIRVGLIGLDTSHATAFSRAMNDPNHAPELAGCRVVAAVAAHSPEVADSVRYLPAVTKEIQELGIEIVPSIDVMLQRVDAVLITSIAGHPHLAQAVPVLRAGKPAFIDKPVAGSLDDAVLLYEVAAHFGTPVFSSSSLRYTDSAKAIRGGSLGDITACDAYSPCPYERSHPDFYWYGIHGVEILFTMMGTGCESVSRVHTDTSDVAVGVWRDGRIGTFRGRRTADNGYAAGYGGTAFGTKAVEPIGPFSGYEPLVAEIVRFFKTKEVPVRPEETLEIYAFMTAADASRRTGQPVRIDDLLEAARASAKDRLANLVAAKAEALGSDPARRIAANRRP
ncbi:MAG: gfo/Idh/MocA family oxidoreductase [Planctomycetes bacterium]|nr:gfo/Idh/MocA family oxidoreductase [Planctomycetota bacterium]